MSQIIESRFRVMEFDSNDVLLNDTVDTGMPVHVNLERDEYSDELQSKVDSLEPGNVVEAEIESESLSIQDGNWLFVDLNVIERTRFHFLENADKHPSIVDELTKLAENISKDTVRKPITSNGQDIGYLTVVVGGDASLWNGLRSGTNTHEYDLENLSQLGGPPHEAIYTRGSDGRRLVFYHLAEKGTEVAEAVLSSNT